MANIKVLIIDDDPTVVKLNESLLTSSGYDVVSAKTGVDGLTLAQVEQPDIIILDVILPEMHGFEVCKNLKENDMTKSIPVIMVTATGLEDIAESEQDISADGYLAKPYGLDDIQKIISDVLAKNKNE